MANIPVSTAIDDLLKSTPSTTVTTAQALTALGAVTTSGALGTPISGTLTNATNLPIVSGTSGTLTVARGGTGAATLTANNVLIGAGTSTPTFVAPSTAGNVLTSNGTTWVSSGGTTPTNATVNTAINTNPAATRYALSAERKQNFGTSIQNLRGQTSKNLRVVTFGDSLVAQGTPLNLSGVIPSAGGFCEAEQSLNVSGTTSLVDDWTYPGGRHAVITSGGTRRWGRYFTTAAAYPFNHANIFKIYYIRGVGTLRLRAEPSLSGTFTDLTGHTAINTITGGDAGTIGVYTVTLSAATTNGVPSSNFWRIDTVCDSGTVKILCVQALANATEARDSYHLSCLGLGGSNDSQWINCQQANWTAVLTEMNPHLIVFKAADFHIIDKTTAGNWATVLTRIRTAAPNAVMLLIDGHPWQDPNYATNGVGNPNPLNDISGWSDGMKAYAALNAPMVQFVECRKFWPDYATMLSSGLINIDGIHLTDTTGRAFESALTLDHVSTLTVAPHINEILSTKIFSRLAGVIGTVKSAYLSGPEWGVTGDLTNANGYIGIYNQLGTGAQPNQGPHLTAFSKASTAKTSGGLAFGLDRTSHQILVQSRVNNRVIVGNLGNTETALTRDSDAQLEVFGNNATVPTLVASCISGQTANIFEVRTSATLSASGTIATAFGPAGALINVPLQHVFPIIGATISNGTPCVIGITAHGLLPNQPVVFTSSDTLPLGITSGTTYYVSPTSFGVNSFLISASINGSTQIATTTAGSGTHTVTPAFYTSSPNTSLVTTAPNQAITLPNGTVGQIKTITHVARTGGGTAFLTPTLATFTSITFTSVGDTVTLQYYASIGWVVLSSRGASVA